MHIFRGIRMVVVRMMIRATCHCEMCATCFPEGGVPTMVKKKKRFHVESAGSFHWGEVSDSSIYRLSKITRHPEILGCQCRNYKRFRRFIPLPSNIGTSSHLPTNFNLHQEQRARLLGIAIAVTLMNLLIFKNNLEFKKLN